MASFVFGGKLVVRHCLRSTVRNFRTSVGILAPIKVSELRVRSIHPAHLIDYWTLCYAI